MEKVAKGSYIAAKGVMSVRGMTGSISKGDTAPKHNTRESYLEGHEPTDLEWIAEHLEELAKKEPNIDFMKTHKNVVIEDRRIEDVYRECFGAAAEAYSAKQVEKGHPERQIPDYLAHVRKDKKLNEMYEFVVQCGNMDDHLTDEQSIAIYKQWLEDFKERYGKQFAVKQAIIHLDEATPHMHVEVVPVAESKRGLSVQNSLNKAVKQAGHDNYKDMLAGWDKVLDTAMKDHGLERVAGDRDKQMGGVDMRTYKRSMEVQKQTAEAEARLECLQGQIAELEPAAVSLGESAGTVISHLGDGSRERALAEEESSLAGEVEELEQQVRAAGEREEELEGQVRGLGGRVRDLGARLEHARMAVTEALKALTAEVPRGLSEIAKGIAHKLNLPISGKDSDDERGCDLDIEAMDARDALETVRVASTARQLIKDAGWQSTCDSPPHGRHQDR